MPPRSCIVEVNAVSQLQNYNPTEFKAKRRVSLCNLLYENLVEKGTGRLGPFSVIL